MAVALLDEIDTISLGVLAVLTGTVLFVFAALMGSLSPANKKFDYLMMGIVPLSFFLTLFIALLFDEGCDRTSQLSISHALNMEYYKVWLPIVAIMMVITFAASFKSIRVVKKHSRMDKNEKK